MAVLMTDGSRGKYAGSCQWQPVSWKILKNPGKIGNSVNSPGFSDKIGFFLQRLCRKNQRICTFDSARRQSGQIPTRELARFSMSASASHADAPTLDETVAEVQRTFRDARAHTAVKRGEAAAALLEVEAQVRMPVGQWQCQW
jgi:hypothetical protein